MGLKEKVTGAIKKYGRNMVVGGALAGMAYAGPVAAKNDAWSGSIDLGVNVGRTASLGEETSVSLSATIRSSLTEKLKTKVTESIGLQNGNAYSDFSVGLGLKKGCVGSYLNLGMYAAENGLFFTPQLDIEFDLDAPFSFGLRAGPLFDDTGFRGTQSSVYGVLRFDLE